MKRAPIILAATAAGLGATLGFHAHTPQTATATAAATATATPAATASSSSSPATTTVTSDAVGTQYGNVQLKVTIKDGKLTAIEAVQLPADEPKSSEISSFAEPQLRASALAKQSADVDFVSGATFTSEGYKAALQSALDKAGFTG